MIFELAKPEDFEAVNRLAKQVTRHHAQWDKNLDPEAEAYPLDWFQDFTKEGAIYENALYVARLNGKVVGFMRFYIWYTNSSVTARRAMLQIDDFGVEEELRNQGIGHKMVDALKELARKEGCSAINLYVDAPNESAITFYQSCGLQIRNHGMTMTL